MGEGRESETPKGKKDPGRAEQTQAKEKLHLTLPALRDHPVVSPQPVREG